MSVPDEFETIEKLLRPLAAPEAFRLMDDAAALPPRPGFDLIVTQDTIVEGVHFLPEDPLDLVARKLLRANLSDLAAKGAAPFGYLLSCAWSERVRWAGREAFARGLKQDQAAFGIRLLGGDTVVTPGPMVFTATLFGWVRAGEMVRRSGAKPGDVVMVSGPIGDGCLGLRAAQGHLQGRYAQALADRYRLPTPRLGIDLSHVSASADISDGLIADAGHIAAASGVEIVIDLARMPLSDGALDWRAQSAAPSACLEALATGGDDYELVVTAPGPLHGFTVIGEVREGQGVKVTIGGAVVTISKPGWRHGKVP